MGTDLPLPKQGAKPPPQFFAHELWPINGWMDPDDTSYGGRPRPTRHCVRRRTQLPSLTGHSPPSPNFRRKNPSYLQNFISQYLPQMGANSSAFSANMHGPDLGFGPNGGEPQKWPARKTSKPRFELQIHDFFFKSLFRETRCLTNVSCKFGSNRNSRNGKKTVWGYGSKTAGSTRN